MSRDAARRAQAQTQHRRLNIQNRTKSRFQLEAETRQQALETAIAPSNKGFAMMQKMGFKPGMSLGKTGR